MRSPSLQHLPVPEEVKLCLRSHGITELKPVQASVFDAAAAGVDVLARARTGDGKTLAFLLPLIAKVVAARKAAEDGGGATVPAVLVVLPTRELAAQVAAQAALYARAAGLRVGCYSGGTDVRENERDLAEGVDIVVGTPGRLRDLKERGKLSVAGLTAQVLDEADRLLGEGFLEEVEAIMVPRGSCQTLMFSATLPVALVRFASRLMRDDKLSVDHAKGEGGFPESVEHIAVSCRKPDRASAIVASLRCYCEEPARAAGGDLALTLVFATTKVEADEIAGGVAHLLGAGGAARVRTLHGDMDQVDRSDTLAAFRAGRVTVLVATDVAARGLDIPGVELVVQCDPPSDIDTYVHRAGRTGRIGCSTGGISLVLYTPGALSHLEEIERGTGAPFRRAAGVGQDTLGGGGGGGNDMPSGPPKDNQPLLQGDFFGGLASDMEGLGGGGGGKKKGGKKGGGRR